MRFDARLGILLAAVMTGGVQIESLNQSTRDQLSLFKRSLPERDNKPSLKPTGHSISGVNRWTGHPHENKREIARHLRQQNRLAA